MRDRRLARLLLPLILFFGLMSCQAPAKGTPSPASASPYGDLEKLDPRGEIITVWYPASYEDVLLWMLDRFNAENHWRIVIRGIRLEDFSHLYARMQSAAAMDRLPNLAIVSPGHLAAGAAEGLAIEMTPYLKSSRWGFPATVWRDFYPFAQDAGQLTRPSGRYGFPFAFSAGLLVYNRGWLQQLGYDHPPRTWEEFQKIACDASNPEEGIYGYEFPADDRTFIRTLIGYGGRIMDEGETSYTLGGTAGLEVLTFLQGLVREKCAVREERWEQAEADFAARRVLFVISSTSHIPHYRQVAAQRGELNWALAPLPTTSDVQGTDFSGVYWMIPPTTPQQQLAAWLVIRWMNEPSQQSRWVALSGYLPHRHLPADAQAALVEETPQYANILPLLDLKGVIEPVVVNYEECRTAIQMMVSAVAAGEEPATWLQRTVESCNATLGKRD